VTAATYSFGTLVGSWLLLAAAIVDVEYYDGLSAICNARYFLGASPFYIFDRGPLMAWLQMPAEWVKGALDLAPLDFRPHHAAMAVLHGAYLVVVFRGLVRCFGETWPVLIACATAITGYVFFSYAPFVSHDLVPGAAFLWMVIWSDELARSFERPPSEGRTRRVSLWLLLVGAGALGPLMKQTYGVFWIAILFAHAVPMMFGHSPSGRVRTLRWLTAGAAASALITWLVYGIVLAHWAPDLPLWLRPYRNLEYLAGVYDGMDVTFPLWIYVRNFWAYGHLTTLLIIPGLVLCLMGSGFQRRVALAWIAAVVFVHALPLREVRYLAFVAPLSAVVIVPAVRVLADKRWALWLMGGLLALDVSYAAIGATRIGQAFYRESELRRLVEPLQPGGNRAPILHTTSMLSFVAPGPSPLAADRYHRVFHVGIHHLGVLYGYPPDYVRIALPPPAVPASARAPEASVLFFSNQILANPPSWMPRPPDGIESFVQGVGVLQTVTVRRDNGGIYRTDPLRPADDYVMPVTVIDDRVYPLVKVDGDGFMLAGPDAPAAPPALTMRAFVVRRMPRDAGSTQGVLR
jgi:hypothetical protein